MSPSSRRNQPYIYIYIYIYMAGRLYRVGIEMVDHIDHIDEIADMAINHGMGTYHINDIDCIEKYNYNYNSEDISLPKDKIFEKILSKHYNYNDKNMKNFSSDSSSLEKHMFNVCVEKFPPEVAEFLVKHNIDPKYYTYFRKYNINILKEIFTTPKVKWYGLEETILKILVAFDEKTVNVILTSEFTGYAFKRSCESLLKNQKELMLRHEFFFVFILHL